MPRPQAAETDVFPPQTVRFTDEDGDTHDVHGFVPPNPRQGRTTALQAVHMRHRKNGTVHKVLRADPVSGTFRADYGSEDENASLEHRTEWFTIYNAEKIPLWEVCPEPKAEAKKP